MVVALDGKVANVSGWLVSEVLSKIHDGEVLLHMLSGNILYPTWNGC